jgi:hypothetical protein
MIVYNNNKKIDFFIIYYLIKFLMSELIEYNGKDEKWIYDAFEEGNMIYDSEKSLYKYFNKKYPNRKYTKTFDPKSFMSRGDVICFGGDYRNERKMIFNGEKLEHLYTEADDYGSVPPTFLVGDNDDEFNIGDFEESIEHNSINWLSKDKLKEIQIYEDANKILGSVIIQGKKWVIDFDIYEEVEFNTTAYGCYNNLKFNFNEEENTIFLSMKNKYSIKSTNNQTEILKKFISENNNLKMIFHTMSNTWYLLKVFKEYKLLDDNNNLSNDPQFPCLVKHFYNEKSYFESFAIDKKQYDFFLQQKDNSKVFIEEIEAYPITIKLINHKKTELINYIQNYINSAIDNFDNIHKRICVNRDGLNSLMIYIS